MQQHLFRATRIGESALLISILPVAVAGQARTVVSNQLAISQTEAALHLEFADNGTLDIALSDGSVTIDGEESGSFERGDALDTAWRTLLGEIVSLSDGPLGEALRTWEAPSSLAGRPLELAQLLDRTLEQALVSDDGSATADPERSVAIDAAILNLDVNLQDLENIRLEIREELREEIREELREEFRDESDEQDRGYRPLQAFGRGITEIVGSVITFLLLSLLALGAVYFGKDNLVLVADTAQRNPMRAGMVGLAGAFLVLPTWLLGGVALAVSVVGLIALPFWLLLFPVAVALGAGLGYLAVARNVGEWVAARDINGLEWLRPTNTFYAITAGIGALLAFQISASVLDIVPFFGFFAGLLATLGTMATMTVALIGFGAVLLTRGGRQAEFYQSDDPFVGERWKDQSRSEEVFEAEELSEDPAENTVPDAADETTTTGTTTGEEDHG